MKIPILFPCEADLLGAFRHGHQVVSCVPTGIEPSVAIEKLGLSFCDESLLSRLQFLVLPEELCTQQHLETIVERTDQSDS